MPEVHKHLEITGQPGVGGATSMAEWKSEDAKRLTELERKNATDQRSRNRWTTKWGSDN